jgi:hypothetical protein
MTTLLEKQRFNGLHYETGSVHNLLACQNFTLPHTNAAPAKLCYWA